MKTRIAFVLLFVFSISITAQVCTNADKEIIKQKFELAKEKKLSEKPIGEVMTEIGRSFIGVEYKAHTIEIGDKEQLVVYVTGLDCYTFLETSLVLSRCIKQGKYGFEDFVEELEKIRYRDGKLDRYPSRLHYFSDFLHNHDSRGAVKIKSKEAGGIPYTKEINFMTRNSDKYPRLKGNDEFIQIMKGIEDKINSRDYYYIPQDSIEACEKNIQPGDLIGLTTNIKGLDISHVGMAVRESDGRIHFLHAPLSGAKVQISEGALPDYVKAVKNATGIMVARPLEP